MTPQKSEIARAFQQRVLERLNALTQATHASRDEATNEQSRPENKYDTRALEASYLAAGQGQRLLELQQLAAFFEQPHHSSPKAGLGALIGLDDGRWVYLAPQGGEYVDWNDVSIGLLGVQSPLGRILLGREVGDEVVWETPRGRREVSITTVC